VAAADSAARLNDIGSRFFKTHRQARAPLSRGWVGGWVKFSAVGLEAPLTAAALGPGECNAAVGGR
jgi:hypothetical protein